MKKLGIAIAATAALACSPGPAASSVPPGTSGPPVAPVAPAEVQPTADEASDPPGWPASGPAFVACGCGCCGSWVDRKVCLHRSRGDDLEEVKRGDREAGQQDHCAVAGCQPGTAYAYCDD